MEKISFENYIEEKILKGEEITPFLFISKQKKDAFLYAEKRAEYLCQKFAVDKNNIFILKNEEDKKIKLEEVKSFLLPSNQKSGFLFQIFIIEDIERMTRESANACLKIFEEPGKGNIFFLTSQSEAGILDTILSRVVTVDLRGEQDDKSYQFASLIEQFVEDTNLDLVSFLYKENQTRQQVVDFLQEILRYLKLKNCFTKDFYEIEEDIMGLQRNNLLPKYLADKYLLLLLKSKIH